MSMLFSTRSLLPFGTLTDGLIKIEQSFTLQMPSENVCCCMLVSAMSRFEGDTPRIRFRISLPDREKPLYLSHSYRIGDPLMLTQQQWRVPPMLYPELTLHIEVELPEGTVLYVKNFSALYSQAPRDHAIGPRHNAHLGLLGMACNNTMPAFELAAICGFPACITVPKLTKDGVLVCTHDDIINHAARREDGSELGTEHVWVKDLTYEELLQYDFGVRKGSVYKGTRIARLEDFFKLCARTGMRPMFSTHPDLPTEKWLEIKEMLTRLGLLKHFHIKTGKYSIIKKVWEIFGSEIDGYTIDVQRFEEDTVARMLATGVDVKACRVGVEIRTEHMQEQDVRRVLEAGMFAAAWNIPRANFDELYERMISWGVTEFTEDHHCSMGLNY